MSKEKMHQTTAELKGLIYKDYDGRMEEYMTYSIAIS